MAKDVSTNKTTTSSSSSISSSDNNSGNTSPSTTDQQKVPPLRIVLNTSGNQKSAYNTIPQQAQNQQNKPQEENKAESGTSLKSSGKVRIKLGSSKQNSSKSGTNEGTDIDDNQKLKSSQAPPVEKQDSSSKEETIANYSHLRRITRRSQRVHQVTVEDEESRTSMTSIDENQSTNLNNQDSGSNQETQSLSTSLNTNETNRRYKRRRCEISENLTSEIESPFKYQNYRPPHQNSFELFKNIRRQVDDKLKSLSSIHPRLPYGFREYMLSRGAYLLDGNKLGNGTNLFMNEDGGIYQAPINEYHALKRRDRINYSVPNRAKVPLGLPVSSPLYNLFIEQEKERYRMRIQHLKEREKLTLAVEQEIMRVYSQAALDDLNQLESLSACTMLKHQEIYNSLDSDASPEQLTDADQDQSKQDRVRTRRRNQSSSENQSSPTSRKEVSAEGSAASIENVPKSKDIDEATPKDNEPQEKTVPMEVTCEIPTDSKWVEESLVLKVEKDTNPDISLNNQVSDGPEAKIDTLEVDNSNEGPKANPEGALIDKSVEHMDETKIDDTESEQKTDAPNIVDDTKDKNMTTKEDSISGCDVTNHPSKSDDISDDKAPVRQDFEEQSSSDSAQIVSDEDRQGQSGEASQDQTKSDEPPKNIEESDNRESQNKEIFLKRLQDIDDKWERIRNEMLIRHRNEAESLHAVQKLEWEWKTKEIGLCDVRTSPTIDDSLVPRLDIHTQDY